MTIHLLLLIVIALFIGSGNAQDDPLVLTGEQKCTTIKGQMYNGHCYWMPSWKGGRFKQNEAADACVLLSSNVVSLDEELEWNFFEKAAPEIVKAVTGKIKGKAFLTGKGAAEAASFDEYASGSNGDKCLEYNVKKGTFKEKPCKLKFTIFCEADNPTQIQLAWSEWINDWTGKKHATNGDDKEIAKKILAKRRNLCPTPLTIECRDSVSKDSHLDTGDLFKKAKFACTLKHGLECRAKYNINKAPCKDYEVRFLCPAVNDECKSGEAKCGEGATCVDTFEGYYCGCGAGQQKNEHGDCGVYGRCLATGDPHFLTFDGLYYDQQGVCRYVTTVPCDLAPADPNYWRVTNDQEHRGRNGDYSYVKAVFIEVYGLKISLQKSRVVLVNDQEVTIPSSPHPGVTITGEKNGAIVKVISLGLVVSFDGNTHMEIDVRSGYGGRLCGLCGNMDGKQENDLMKKDGSVVAKAQVYDFINDWLAPGLENPNCEADQPGPVTCAAGEKATYSTKDKCGIMTDTDGPFADGIAVVEAGTFFDDCVFDMCAFDGEESVLCDAINAFEEAIGKSGDYVFIDTWRNDTFCPYPCPKNSHYSEVVSPCADSCYVPPGKDTCEGEPYEGCEADDGFVKNGDNGGFILEEECGCTDDDGSYYKLGARWRSSDCTNDYKCRINGEIFIMSQNPPCPANSKCISAKVGTPRKCKCDAGFSKAKDGGDKCIADDNPPPPEPPAIQIEPPINPPPEILIEPPPPAVLPPKLPVNPPAPVIPQGLPDVDEPASEYRANWCGGKWYIRQL